MSGFLFLHPLFAWLLPLAGLPILFHFFLRIRKRTRVFSTLMFFHRLDPQLSSRRRLREWLILLLRCLLILFFLLALAGPVRRSGGGRGRLAVVFVLDNSASMGRAAPGERPHLERAVDAVRALVGALRKDDTAGIVLLVRDPAVSLPGGLTSDRALLGAALDQVGPTDGAGAPGDALDRAVRLLDAAPAPHAVVQVFSDLQRNEWNRLPVSLPHPRAGTTVLVHRFTDPDAAAEANVALRNVALPARFLVAGRPGFAELVLRNTGERAVPLRLNTRDDAGQTKVENATLLGGEEKRMRIAIGAETAGRHWVEAWIEGDDFAGDNRAGIALDVLPRQEALFVGRAADYGLLPAALAPTGDGQLTGLQPRFIDSPALASEGPGPTTRLLVLTWDRLRAVAADGADAVRALHGFVENGGNVLLAPAPGAVAPVPGLPEWVGAAPEARIEDSEGALLRAFVRDAPVLEGLRSESGEVNLGGARARRYRPLRLSGSWQALLGLENGIPLLAGSTIGRGRLFASGLVFDPGDTTLPLKGSFVALVQNMALAAQPGESAGGARAVVAGAPLTRLPGTNATISVRTLAGPSLDWKGSRSTRLVLPRAGVYAISDGARTVAVGVRSAPDESRPRYLGGDLVPALGDLRYAVSDFRGADRLVEATARLRRSTDFYLPFLLLALAALMAEGWLANSRMRGRAGGGARRKPARGREPGPRSPHAAVATPS